MYFKSFKFAFNERGKTRVSGFFRVYQKPRNISEFPNFSEFIKKPEISEFLGFSEFISKVLSLRLTNFRVSGFSEFTRNPDISEFPGFSEFTRNLEIFPSFRVFPSLFQKF